jgi:hypothetical protein
MSISPLLSGVTVGYQRPRCVRAQAPQVRRGVEEVKPDVLLALIAHRR